MKKSTKATARAAVKRHAAHIDAGLVALSGDCVALFCSSIDTDATADIDALERAATAIARDCGGAPMTGNGSAWFVWFKKAPVTFGHDPMDKASPHHW